MFLITVSNIMLYPRNPGEPAPRGARAVSLGRVVTVVTPPTSIYCRQDSGLGSSGGRRAVSAALTEV